MLEAYARPEDDDPAYGDGFETDGKIEQAGGMVQAETTSASENGILWDAGGQEKGQGYPVDTVQSRQGGQ